MNDINNVPNDKIDWPIEAISADVVFYDGHGDNFETRHYTKAFENEIIPEFRGPTRWLSNFHMCEIHYNGMIFQSTEHAYQAAKCINSYDALLFTDSHMTCSEAKKKGMMVLLRPDWESVKLNVMYEVNNYKFNTHNDLKEKLLATGDAILQEGNSWGDTFWGICNGKGSNHLGRILMKIRDNLRYQH
jgi:N-glycosidase YbiA